VVDLATDEPPPSRRRIRSR